MNPSASGPARSASAWDRSAKTRIRNRKDRRFSHQTLRNRLDDRFNRPDIWRSHVTTRPGQEGTDVRPDHPADAVRRVHPGNAAARLRPAPTSAPTPAAPSVAGQRRSVGPGFVLSAVLASALLASGGTYLAVSAATGTPPAPAATPVGNVASTGSLAGGTNSVVDIVKAVSPAVVTIVADGITSTDPATGQTAPGFGDRLRRHLRCQRADPDQPPRRRGRPGVS